MVTPLPPTRPHLVYCVWGPFLGPWPFGTMRPTRSAWLKAVSARGRGETRGGLAPLSPYGMPVIPAPTVITPPPGLCTLACHGSPALPTGSPAPLHRLVGRLFAARRLAAREGAEACELATGPFEGSSRPRSPSKAEGHFLGVQEVPVVFEQKSIMMSVGQTSVPNDPRWI